jgi:hypothetical protein
MQGAQVVQDSFFQWHIGNIIELGTVIIMSGAYFLSRKTENRERREGMARASKEREEALVTQTRMHTQNSASLQILMKFQEQQLLINGKRDDQIGQLTALAAASAEMIRGLDRRLQLMENRLENVK